LLGPSSQNVVRRCLGDIKRLPGSRWRKARPL
jgi:hypothetical protein